MQDPGLKTETIIKTELSVDQQALNTNTNMGNPEEYKVADGAAISMMDIRASHESANNPSGKKTADKVDGAEEVKKSVEGKVRQSKDSKKSLRDSVNKVGAINKNESVPEVARISEEKLINLRINPDATESA